MIDNDNSKFCHVAEYADEWLEENDLDFQATHFSEEGNQLGLFLVHSEDVYATGYKRAADQIVLTIGATAVSDRSIMYPVVYLYRHYIELKLKEMLSLTDYFERRIPTKRDKHDLPNLWKEASSAIGKYWPIDQIDHLERVQRYVQLIAKLESNPSGFRYPYSVDGKKVLVGTLRSINLECVRASMSRLSSFLAFCILRLQNRLGR